MLYPNQNVESLAVNMKGDLFFSNGTLYRAPADKTGMPVVESEYFESVRDIFYKSNELFFIGEDSLN